MRKLTSVFMFAALLTGLLGTINPPVAMARPLAQGAPVVYVVIAIDTEADNNHPMGSYHTVFDIHNYLRPPESCPPYETQYSANGSAWSSYSDGTVFNFQVRPTGQEDPVAAFTCGDNNAYGLDDYHRAVRFTVPEDGFYDVQVQIYFVGSPPDTHIYVVPDASGHPDTGNPLSDFLVSTSTVVNGTYNTVAENLELDGGVPYWWYAQRQSGGDDDNQFAVYRGVSGAGSTTISQIMDEDFRNTHTDSLGNPFKMSWFMEMDNYINQGQLADGTPFDYLTLYDLMMENWGDEVESWGDEIAYHHHFMHWGGSDWVHTTDLAGYDWHNEALDYMILDGGFFPTTFRSGWLWSNNQLQAWIEDWMPIDYSNLPGNEYWRNAPTSWFPYHPSESDYQAPGDMDHWIARCNSGPSQSTVNSAFAEAQSTEEPVIYCWYAHKRDDMRGRIASAQGYLDNAAQAYGVPFEYATATEAMQAVAGCTDTTSPTLSLTEAEGTYTIASDERLWGAHPYVAAKYAGESGLAYTHTLATSVGTNLWEIFLPAELAIAAPPEPYTPVGVTAESEHPEHPAEDAVDGNPDTYWDSTPQEVPVWIQVDLGEARDVGELMIHFWDGDGVRQYTYYVEASTDGTAWTEIVPSNTVHGMITHEFAPTISMRYARATVTGNNGPNDYAHIREIALSSGADPEPDVFYLQQVGAAALDLCGNSAVVTHTVNADLSVAKTSSADFVRVGNTLTYTVVITNNSPWGVTGMTLTDTLPSGVTYGSATPSQGDCSGTSPVVCELGDLADSATAMATIVVTPTTAGTIVNTADVAATDPHGNPVTETATVSVDVISPDVAIVKTADPPVANVGDMVNYTVAVDNTGDSDLTGVTVDDHLAGCTLSGPDGDTHNPGVLDLDEVWEYTCSVTAGSSDVVNTATVSATDLAGGTVGASDTVTVTVIHPSVEIAKTADPTMVNVGDTVNYTITVDNTGDSGLTGVTVDDHLAGCTLSGPDGDTHNPGVLDLDEVWEYTCAITAGSEDIVNIATVSATDEAGGTVGGSAQAEVDVIHPDVEIIKTADPMVANAGDPVTYTITVENTGDSDLTDVTVDDGLPACVLSGPTGDIQNPGVLDQGEVWEYTCSVTAGGSDIVNTATATATDEAGGTVSDSDTITVTVIHPDIEIVKTADPTVVNAGDTINYTVTVDNTGDSDFMDVTVDDHLVGCTLSGPGGDTHNPGVLDQDEVWEYTCSVTADSSDIENVATVIATDEAGGTLSRFDVAFVDVINPFVNFVKTAEPRVVNVGDTVNYTITAENTGDSGLADVIVDDHLAECILSGPDGDAQNPGVLDPDEVWGYTCSVTAGDDDILNTATFTATDEAGGTVSDSAHVEVDVIHPDVRIVKTADSPMARVGDTVTYTLAVENAGDSGLTGVTVDDHLVGCTLSGPDGDVQNPGVLDPDEVWEYTCSVTAGSDDILNTAIFTATDEAGGTVGGSAQAEVDVIHPDIEIAKTPDIQTVVSGSPVTFTIAVTNTGDVTLTNVAVTDALAPACDASLGGLAARASVSYNCTITNVTADFTNSATVTGVPPAGAGVTDTDTATVHVEPAPTPPGITIYLPITLKRFTPHTPDLVVERIIATRNSVQVVVKNQGDAPASSSDPFWVDLYVDPTPVPTGVNQVWTDLCEEGLVWGVEAPALPLEPGGMITLTVGDAYYWPDYSSVSWPLTAGTPIYVQVDSADVNTTYGAVLEGHEISGGPYNNIRGTTVSTSAFGDTSEGPGQAERPAAEDHPPASSYPLPPRR